MYFEVAACEFCVSEIQKPIKYLMTLDQSGVL